MYSKVYKRDAQASVFAGSYSHALFEVARFATITTRSVSEEESCHQYQTRLAHASGWDSPTSRLLSRYYKKCGRSAKRIGHDIGGCLFSSQANNSPIVLPEFAIFIGRPLRLVNVVSSEIPSALHTLAITSCEVYGSVSTLVPSSLVLPTAIPPFIPAPPTTTLQARAQ